MVTVAVMAVYGMALGAGVLMRIFASADVYQTYKDLIGLFIPIPAAWLAFSFQSRLSYVQAGRTLWRTILNAVHSARSYTLLSEPSEKDYRQVVEALAIALDEVRGLFRNLPVEGKPRGWYPFEPIRDMLRVMEDLHWGPHATRPRRDAARDQLDEFWPLVREPLLLELERDLPTEHHVNYAPRRPLSTVDSNPTSVH
jgi:hypothetical protein